MLYFNLFTQGKGCYYTALRTAEGKLDYLKYRPVVAARNLINPFEGTTVVPQRLMNAGKSSFWLIQHKQHKSSSSNK